MQISGVDDRVREISQDDVKVRCDKNVTQVGIRPDDRFGVKVSNSFCNFDCPLDARRQWRALLGDICPQVP